MSVSSRALVEFVLLGPTNDRRQLQDSPVLGDVWIAFAAKPAAPMDLLVTPHKVREDWSPEKHGLTAFFAAHPAFAEKVSIVQEDAPHVINLLDKIEF